MNMAVKDELFSLRLPLRCRADSAALSARSLPRWWGRAVQAAFLRHIKLSDPALAEQLHAENCIRPYTVSGLMGARPADLLSSEKNYAIHLTAFTRPLCEQLETLIRPGGGLAPGQTLILDYLPFEILPPENDPLSASFSDLVAWGVSQGRQSALALQFSSPLLFKSEGKTQPFPLPGLVFHSLLERWNAFAPLSFPPELGTFAAECLAVSGFTLRSLPVALNESALRIGALGRVRYRALNPDPYWLSMLHALTRFAGFSGVGAGTAWGLGQTRPILPDRQPRLSKLAGADG